MHHTPDDGTAAVAATLGILGGKWKILILWHLRGQPRRYGELRRLIPQIAEKMLIQQLRDLEHDAVVARTVYPEVPPRVEYTMTDYGRTLAPVLAVLCAWGEEHLRRVGDQP